jgi:hypothetical protein
VKLAIALVLLSFWLAFVAPVPVALAPTNATRYEAPEPTPSPTPIPLPTAVGVASWYDATKNSAWYTRTTKWGDPVEFYAAAGPKLRDLLGDPNPYHEHYPVRITNPKTGVSILAVVVDWCQCSKGKPGEKLVDLSPSAWLALAGGEFGLGRGIQKVIVEVLP